MRPNRVHWILGVAIVALSVFECLQTFPSLPEPMASNFGGDGVPGGWSSKSAFMVIYSASTAFWLAALFGAPLVAISARQRLDDGDRRWLRDRIGGFAVATGGLSAVVTHWVIEANLVTGRLSDWFVWLLGLYLVFVLWWTVTLVRRVRRVENSKSPTSP